MSEPVETVESPDLSPSPEALDQHAFMEQYHKEDGPGEGGEHQVRDLMRDNSWVRAAHLPVNHSEAGWKAGRRMPEGIDPEHGEMWDGFRTANKLSAFHGEEPIHPDDYREMFESDREARDQHRESVSVSDVLGGFGLELGRKSKLDSEPVQMVSEELGRLQGAGMSLSSPGYRGAIKLEMQSPDDDPEYWAYGLLRGEYLPKKHAIRVDRSGESFAHEWFHAVDGDLGLPKSWWRRAAQKVKTAFDFTKFAASNGQGDRPESRHLESFVKFLSTIPTVQERWDRSYSTESRPGMLDWLQGDMPEDPGKDLAEYMLSPHEVWARFGAQLVSYRSAVAVAQGRLAHPTLLANPYSELLKDPGHWTHEEFSRIVKVWERSPLSKMLESGIRKALGFGVFLKSEGEQLSLPFSIRAHTPGGSAPPAVSPPTPVADSPGSSVTEHSGTGGAAVSNSTTTDSSPEVPTEIVPPELTGEWEQAGGGVRHRVKGYVPVMSHPKYEEIDLHPGASANARAHAYRNRRVLEEPKVVDHMPIHEYGHSGLHQERGWDDIPGRSIHDLEEINRRGVSMQHRYPSVASVEFEPEEIYSAMDGLQAEFEHRFQSQLGVVNKHKYKAQVPDHGFSFANEESVRSPAQVAAATSASLWTGGKVEYVRNPDLWDSNELDKESVGGPGGWEGERTEENYRMAHRVMTQLAQRQGDETVSVARGMAIPSHHVPGFLDKMDLGDISSWTKGSNYQPTMTFVSHALDHGFWDESHLESFEHQLREGLEQSGNFEEGSDEVDQLLEEYFEHHGGPLGNNGDADIFVELDMDSEVRHFRESNLGHYSSGMAAVVLLADTNIGTTLNHISAYPGEWEHVLGGEATVRDVRRIPSWDSGEWDEEDFWDHDEDDYAAREDHPAYGDTGEKFTEFTGANDHLVGGLEIYVIKVEVAPKSEVKKGLSQKEKPKPKTFQDWVDWNLNINLPRKGKEEPSTNKDERKEQPVITKGPTWSGHKLQGRAKVEGMDISIENARGSVRSGVDPDGNKWETKMRDPYGYIRRTLGVDGDHLDCFLGPLARRQAAGEDVEIPKVWVVHSRDIETGKYDEDKVMLGYKGKSEAVSAFRHHYTDPDQHIGPVSEFTMEEFKHRISDTMENPRRLGRGRWVRKSEDESRAPSSPFSASDASQRAPYHVQDEPYRAPQAHAPTQDANTSWQPHWAAVAPTAEAPTEDNVPKEELVPQEEPPHAPWRHISLPHEELWEETAYGETNQAEAQLDTGDIQDETFAPGPEFPGQDDNQASDDNEESAPADPKPTQTPASRTRFAAQEARESRAKAFKEQHKGYEIPSLTELLHHNEEYDHDIHVSRGWFGQTYVDNKWSPEGGSQGQVLVKYGIMSEEEQAIATEVGELGIGPVVLDSHAGLVDIDANSPGVRQLESYISQMRDRGIVRGDSGAEHEGMGLNTNHPFAVPDSGRHNRRAHLGDALDEHRGEYDFDIEERRNELFEGTLGSLGIEAYNDDDLMADYEPKDVLYEVQGMEEDDPDAPYNSDIYWGEPEFGAYLADVVRMVGGDEYAVEDVEQTYEELMEMQRFADGETNGDLDDHVLEAGLEMGLYHTTSMLERIRSLLNINKLPVENFQMGARMAMEYLEGYEPVDGLFGDQYSFDSGDVEPETADDADKWVRASLGILDMMSIFHGEGLTHGDLHTYNVMWDGEVGRLIDFGMAQRYDQDSLDWGAYQNLLVNLQKGLKTMSMRGAAEAGLSGDSRIAMEAGMHNLRQEVNELAGKVTDALTDAPRGKQRLTMYYGDFAEMVREKTLDVSQAYHELRSKYL